VLVAVSADEPASTRASVAPSRTSDGVGAATEEELERLDEQGLPAPVSPVIAVSPVRPTSDLVDDPEVGDPQLDEHRRLPVGEAELGLQDLVEVAACERHDARRLGPDVHVTVVEVELPELATVDGQSAPRRR
jgi:hypothetical protein